MKPGAGGGEHGCKVHGHPPATGCRGRDEDTPLHPPPPFPATKVSLEMKKAPQRQPAADLPADAIVEILSRVPYKSLCRFKCVSMQWLALCSDPKVRKSSLQTQSGFFFNKSSCGLSFSNLSGRGTPIVDPSLPFLRGFYERVEVEKCCGGLLLCKYWKSYKGRNMKKYGYAVCNPVTGLWNVLPIMVLRVDGIPVIYEDDEIDELFLGFDRANPSRFVVFATLGQFCGKFVQAAIFSSETRRWTSVGNGWGDETGLVGNSEYALLNDTMHFSTYGGTMVTVDMKGKVWREIEMPDNRPDTKNYTSIGQSQGCLYAWQIDFNNDNKLWVWVLEDYVGVKWTLKHTVNVSELFGKKFDENNFYTMFAIHPDCNLVFLDDGNGMTVSYNMDNQKVSVISASGTEFGDNALYLYVPSFAESLSAGH